MKYENFETEEERGLKADFLRDGYIRFSVENLEGLYAVRDLIVDAAQQHLGISSDAADVFLNSIHKHVSPAQLNALRLSVIQTIRETKWFRATYYSLARDMLSKLVGNELAMQRGLGLSVQLPGDSSSLLPTHADVWSGDSKFETVLWVPLVDCHDSKSMYLMTPQLDLLFQESMALHQYESAEGLYKLIEDKVNFLDVPFGSAILFNQNLMHGNRVNTEDATRWSMNCRFKNLMAPFGDKKLGEFFEPITVKAQTAAAIAYDLPNGFEE